MGGARCPVRVWRGPAACLSPPSRAWGALATLRRAQFGRDPRTVGKMPWWMQAFAPRTPRGAAAAPLPPWPVDEVEFSTTQPGGGHDERLAREAPREEGSQEAWGGPEAARALLAGASKPLSEAARGAVRGVEATAAGRAALAAGGWVCARCLHAMPHRSRAVCDRCHALRHDAATAVRGWCADSENWICGRCFEFNFDRDGACRCCGTARAESKEMHVVHHESIADQVRRAAVGSVINSRDRFCRWLCPGCEEVNSLQSSTCRHCNRERFNIVVGCPHCRAPRQLHNAQVYGSTPQDRKHALSSFGVHNCVARLSSEQRCEACGCSLHGGPLLSHARTLWWCACGVFNVGGSHSCQRCRLPRAIMGGGVLERILKGAQWDFQTCTSWFCESCDGINIASRSVVFLRRDHTLNNSSRKYTRLIHGDVNCTHCGVPWHHHVLRDRACWRCACHLINSSEDEFCRSCYLPAADSIGVDVLSFWAKGDWICGNCQAHCYRDRARCNCGNPRIKQEGRPES